MSAKKQAIQIIMMLHNEGWEEKTIRYLMAGIVEQDRFTGIVYDYTGGGEHTEFLFRDGVDTEDEYENDAEECFGLPLWADICSSMDEHQIDVNSEGYYVYKGDRVFSQGELMTVGSTIEPIEVGNTGFIETNTSKEVGIS